ncbi:MAG: hypothetical protein IKN66_03085 [Ruminococcus sp.]|nr:hypothetical protein [Ruminococcus sp.]
MDLGRMLFTASAISMVCFCACADSKPSSMTVSEEAVSSAAETADESFSTSDDDKYCLMDVEVKGYNGEVLSFEYEGNTYSVKFDRRSFASDTTLSEPRKSLSEEVINNALGETVKAKLCAKKDLSYIEYCDVLSVNGRYLENPSDPSHVSSQEDREYTLKRLNGTKCRLQNCDYTFDVDIKDLPMCMKEIYSNELKPVLFSGYLFDDGRFLIYELLTYPVTDEFGQETYGIGKDDYVTNNCLGFIGKVRSINGDKAEILLNDGKTVCTVPTYFSEGEIAVGQNTVIFVDDDASLRGSGEKKEYSFALIYTDTGSLKLSEAELSEAAYIIPHDLYRSDFEAVSVSHRS